jgi:hypothetical protein
MSPDSWINLVLSSKFKIDIPIIFIEIMSKLRYINIRMIYGLNIDNIVFNSRKSLEYIIDPPTLSIL